MKKGLLISLCTIAFIAILGSVSRANAMEPKVEKKPIVSASWLALKCNQKNHIIIDVREAEAYQKGHIEGAINIPWVVPDSAWIRMVDDLLLEMPEVPVLKDMLGSYGIGINSKVVIVTTSEPYPLASGTRAAMTLKYAGIKHISILDGGYTKWVADGYPITTKVPEVKPVNFKEEINNGILVTMDYVHSKIGSGTTVIVDARDAAVYSGEVIDTHVPEKIGHIPTAVSLPAPVLWNEDGTYKTKSELQLLTTAAVGSDKDKEIIVYCSVGGYASTVYYVLSEVLGYKNVKVYDGSAQEWVRYYDMLK